MEREKHYADLILLIVRISDYLVKAKTVRERIGDAIMGGKVLTLWSEELLAEGEARGKAEGKAEGQNMLVEAIQRLRKGETAEELIAGGIDRKTVELAKACL